jgi:hypothetical protein
MRPRPLKLVRGCGGRKLLLEVVRRCRNAAASPPRLCPPRLAPIRSKNLILLVDECDATIECTPYFSCGALRYGDNCNAIQSSPLEVFLMINEGGTRDDSADNVGRETCFCHRSSDL